MNAWLWVSVISFAICAICCALKKRSSKPVEVDKTAEAKKALADLQKALRNLK